MCCRSILSGKRLRYWPKHGHGGGSKAFSGVDHKAELPFSRHGWDSTFPKMQSSPLLH